MSGVSVAMLKCPRQTAYFRKGQKVWVRYLSGDLAAECVGRFRGRGRYVVGWVKWSERDAPTMKTFEVSADFAQRHGLERVDVAV